MGGKLLTILHLSQVRYMQSDRNALYELTMSGLFQSFEI